MIGWVGTTTWAGTGTGTGTGVDVDVGVDAGAGVPGEELGGALNDATVF